MFIREDAKDLTKDLAAKGLSKTKIRKELEKQGMAGLLHDSDIDAIMTQAGFGRNMARKSPGTLLVRCLGVIAIFASLFYIFFIYRGYTTRGVTLLILGLLLTFKPDYADDRL